MKRKTMHALVLGSHGSGKSTLLQVLKNKGVPDPPVLEPLAKEVISAAASFNHSASVAAEVLEDPVLNATVASGASAGCYGLDPSDPFSSLHYSVNTNGFNLIMTEIPVLSFSIDFVVRSWSTGGFCCDTSDRLPCSMCCLL